MNGVSKETSSNSSFLIVIAVSIVAVLFGAFYKLALRGDLTSGSTHVTSGVEMQVGK